MKLDAMIYFRSKAEHPKLENELGAGFVITPIDEYDAEEIPEATHEVDCGGSRYYGKDYERGRWTLLAAVLMELHASEDVEKVWYGNDCSTPLEITPEGVNGISLHFMKHGELPYRRGRIHNGR